ncbi:MAG TPA: AMP-binding protein [Solirubrobacteraceae bacterium]|jgi:acetyl-CoA synthetase|nr:AMP-binding protein [Solirubrobacteraceae bacterium]
MEHFDLDHYGRLRDLPNEVIAREFRWQVPERLNAGIEVCDRHAEAGLGLAMRWMGADGSIRDFSYGDLRAASNRVANLLSNLGVREGDFVFTVLPRVPEHWIVLIGAMKVGAVVSCLSTTFGTDAIAVRVADARPRVVFTNARQRDRVAPAAAAAGALVIEVDDDGPGGLHDRMDAASDEYSPLLRASADPAFLYFTSGTTGPPKGSLHGSDQLAGGLALMATSLDLRPDDIFWPTSDLGWVTGVLLTFSALCQATPFRTLESDFDAERWWRILECEQVTNFFTVPTAYRMLRADEGIVERDGLRFAVRRLGSVGEPLDPATLAWGQERFGAGMFELYGQTEHGGGACCQRPFWPVRPGSLGKPLPYLTVALLGADGHEVPTGEEGEIATRADYPALFKGYLSQPEKTRETLRGDGWHRTGDLAHQDADGYVWYHARADDVISSGGYRIGPAEVENALLDHPAVHEAAVVGKPDEQRGQIVKAWVVLRPGVRGDETLIAELQQHCKARAGGWNYPREVEFLTELPRTATGKVRRVELREIDAQRAAARS